MQAEYLSIGKVAKLKNISIKALRYYDEIGVFVPAYVNPDTNYRYYTAEQLPLLDAVNLCLKLGIPLKTLPAYINNDTFDFSALLSDTRKLAEEKIQGIRLALDKIQSSSSVSCTAGNIPQSSATSVASSIPAQPHLTATYDSDEYLVALPLSEELLPPYDGFVLQLFIFARQRNLILENPSGILYRYENGYWHKYLCLKLTLNANISPEVMASVFIGSEFALFKIPSNTYVKHLRTQSLDTPLDNSISVFGSLPDGHAPSLLERRLPDSNPNDEYSFELLHLHTIKCN